MSLLGRSLLDFDTITDDDLFSILQAARKMANQGFPRFEGSRILAPLFFESSTRTYMSFQVAGLRLNMQPLVFNPSTSSINKGESIEHTVLTVAALKPDLLVIRHGGEDGTLKSLSNKIEIPIINAGEGVTGHPTQALIDAFTILDDKSDLKDLKVLIVGDSRYSRVAHSNYALLTRLGAEVAFCAPSGFRAEIGSRRFDNITEALEWADVCMALRAQDERHPETSQSEIVEWYKSHQINSDTLKSFSKDGLIMHPGPFRLGEEISAEILEDPRCRIFQQKANGVLIRAALMWLILNDVEAGNHGPR